MYEKIFESQQKISLFTKLILCVVLLTASGGVAAAGAAPTITTSELSAAPTLQAMVGQMILVGFRGTGEDPGEADLPDLLRSIRNGQVGGVIYFDYDVVKASRIRNIRSLEQLKALSAMLQEAAPIPLFIAIDQEGGKVQRIAPPVTTFNLPSAETMGKGSPEATFKAGHQTGSLLRSVGINVNLAPTVDCNVNSQSPAIGKKERAFSADPATVAVHARQFAQGLAKAGVIACYKHFPGHGSATDDSHLGITDITATWSADELIPYEPQNRPHVPLMILPGHLFNANLDPNLPTSISRAAITGLLREKLGWNGVVISDDLDMKALTKFYTRREIIALSIEAGVDVLLAANNLEHTPDLARIIHEDVMALVAEGRIAPERIKESYDRIMTLKQQGGLLRP